jgi:hypothetical protein
MFDLPVVQIGSVTMDGIEPVFMLGPCVMESEPFIWDVAERIDFQGILRQGQPQRYLLVPWHRVRGRLRFTRSCG